MSNEDFVKAQKYYENLSLEFDFEEHYSFHSIFPKDPEGHTVELTTIVVEEKIFTDKQPPKMVLPKERNMHLL